MPKLAKKPPFLTVGIPAFNGETSLERAVRSVQSQTWQGDMEILVYNDGSTDNTLATAERLAAEDPRVIVSGEAQNRGRSYARNQLLTMAKGEYFAWLDDDDEWLPQKLERQFATLRKAKKEHPEDAVWCLCPCRIEIRRESGHVFSPNLRMTPLKAILRGKLRAYLHTTVGTTASMREVGGFDPQFPRLQDMDFFIRFAAKGGRFVCTERGTPLSIYNKGNRKRDSQELDAAARRIWKKHRGLFEGFDKEFLRRGRFHLLNLPAAAALHNGEYLNFARHFIRCLGISPYWTVKHYGQKKLLRLLE